ncbi:hypothetical protein [Treponema pedis]|uniref:hypothetical protein n=1 Tax=Treponema pedis TaxID=409322 RepID=UPI0004643055|nr:hypothetical protein [Treponema pedis]
MDSKVELYLYLIKNNLKFPEANENCSENCADLTAGIINAGGLFIEKPKVNNRFFVSEHTDPNLQYEEFTKEYVTGSKFYTLDILR